MLTYALFIATDPDPVSSSDWAHIDDVYDRARLSSGGTVVKVRATEGTGTEAADYDLDIATFINGIHLEVRDETPESFTYFADGKLIADAKLTGGEWLLTRVPPATPDEGPIAYVPEAGHTRDDAEIHLGKIVEDWLS